MFLPVSTTSGLHALRECLDTECQQWHSRTALRHPYAEWSWTIMQAYTNTNSTVASRQGFINPNHVQEVRYWAEEFHIPPARLIAVVREVGRNLYEVRKRLAM